MGFSTDRFHFDLLSDVPEVPGPDPRVLDRFRGEALAANVWLVARRLPLNPAEPPVMLVNFYGRTSEDDGAIHAGINYFNATRQEVRDATIEVVERLMEEGLYHDGLDGLEIIPQTRALHAVVDLDAAGDPGMLPVLLDDDDVRTRKALRRTLFHGSADDARVQRKMKTHLTHRSVLPNGNVRVEFRWRLNEKGPGRRPRA